MVAVSRKPTGLPAGGLPESLAMAEASHAIRLRVLNAGYRLKSRSMVSNSRTPWLRQIAAILAS